MNTNQLKDTAVSYALANGLLHGEIIEGKHDDIPESAFLLAGTIDDVIAQSRKGE